MKKIKKDVLMRMAGRDVDLLIVNQRGYPLTAWYKYSYVFCIFERQVLKLGKPKIYSVFIFRNKGNKISTSF